VYLVGAHPNSPQNPHSAPASGGTEILHIRTSPQSEAHVLYGALVGGPLSDDKFWDWRDDYIETEVALDYNAMIPTLAAMQVGLPLSCLKSLLMCMIVIEWHERPVLRDSTSGYLLDTKRPAVRRRSTMWQRRSVKGSDCRHRHRRRSGGGTHRWRAGVVEEGEDRDVVEERL
jgi:hypothetical protein